MSVTSTKLDALILEFNKGKSLSLEDIKNITGSKSKQSIFNYIYKCEEAGMEFEKETISRKVYYKEKKSELTNNTFIRMDNEAIEKFVVLETMRRNGFTRKNNGITATMLYEILCIGNEKFEDVIHLKCKRTHFFDLIDELKEEKRIKIASCITNEMLEKDAFCKKGVPYYYSESVGHDLEEGNFGEILNDWIALYVFISSIPKQHPYYRELKNIEKKLALIAGDAEKSNFENTIAVYGNAYHGMDNFEEEYKKINKYDYANKILKIRIGTKDNKSKDTYISVSKLVYSMEQDCMYLFGKSVQHPYGKKGNKKERIEVIKLQSVVDIMETELDNKYYKNEDINHYIQHMLGISTDESIINTSFEISDEISIRDLEKLKGLSSSVLGKIHHLDNGKYKFIGEIAGAGALKRFLRQYGDKVLNIDNSEIKKEMRQSIERMINNYKEVITDEKL